MKTRRPCLPIAALLLLLCLLTGCQSSPTAASGTDSLPVDTDTAFTSAPTTNPDALWQDYRQSETAQRLLAMLDNKAIVVGDDTMPLHIELIWDNDEPMPAAGYPVFISLHGGGAFTDEENREQWEIQFTRYPGVRGLYICPHSPIDDWDQWHHQRIFKLIDTLVRALLLRDNVDPNRVYLGGYCSGGNGVYQLAPLLADRFAACSATKAIREGAPLQNLRNLPIDLQWGEHDHEALDRPAHNRDNVDTLLQLQRADPQGYTFRDVEHWRQGKIVNDKSTMRWMARFTRNPHPDRVVWHQDSDIQPQSNPPQYRMYWLSLDERYAHDGQADYADARIDRHTNTITLDTQGYETLTIQLNDQLIDLARPITLIVNGQSRAAQIHWHTRQQMLDQLKTVGDRALVYPASIRVQIR